MFKNEEIVGLFMRCQKQNILPTRILIAPHEKLDTRRQNALARMKRFALVF